MTIVANNATSTRNLSNRVLLMSLAASVFSEFILLVVYGIILFPEGNLLNKTLWTLVYCGLGMGATVAAFINLFVTDRYTGLRAIILTTVIAVVLLGFLCDGLCYRLDLRFDYFGAPHMPPLFFHVSSWVGSLVGGALVGYLSFGKR